MHERVHHPQISLDRDGDEVVGGGREEAPLEETGDPQTAVDVVEEAGQDALVLDEFRGDNEGRRDQIDEALVEDEDVGVSLPHCLRQTDDEDDQQIIEDADHRQRDVPDAAVEVGVRKVKVKAGRVVDVTRQTLVVVRREVGHVPRRR